MLAAVTGQSWNDQAFEIAIARASRIFLAALITSSSTRCSIAAIVPTLGLPGAESRSPAKRRKIAHATMAFVGDLASICTSRSGLQSLVMPHT